MSELDKQTTNGDRLNGDRFFYPEGEALRLQIDRRRRRGLIWRLLFMGALTVAMLSLTALLYNITNDAFGLTIVINKTDPERLVLDLLADEVLGASATVGSEDDNLLAAGIVNDIDGIGFFGNAYYVANRDSLRLVAIDGRVADSDDVADYPLARPLYLYSAESVLVSNQTANIFLNYLLTNVNDDIGNVGYLAADERTTLRARQNWLSANQDLGLTSGQWAVINPDGLGGRVTLSGSSTVNPLTEYMLATFTADGFAGSYDNASVGSSAGIAAFCAGQADIAASSRPIKSGEIEACRRNGRFPLEFQIGVDTLALVVNRDNDWIADVTADELALLFSEAVTWADVNPAWPNRPIKRFIPGADSGTLDFFIESVFETRLAELPKEDLVRLLRENVTLGRGRTLERDQRFFETALVFESPELWNEVCARPANERPSGCTGPVRDQAEVYGLVVREVIQPDVVQVYKLVDSIFKRQEIVAEAATLYPNGVLEFRSWLTTDFIRNPQSSTPEYAGVRTAILGSLWVILVTILFSFPVGVSAAIYLEEYASDTWLNRTLQTNINNLAGVPSIIYGMLGLAVFVRALEMITSGAIFGLVEADTTANGRTILSAGLTLGLLILPLIIINAQEAIRAVPGSMRQASLALGATRWQTVWYHVLPSALPGILTGAILAVSRAIGETAPLVVVGASTFITFDPSGPFSKFTTLPIQIYQWTSRPQAEFRNIAAAAIVVLLTMLLTLNATAIVLRNRYTIKS
jgi:phosphate transport system permease protein